MMINNHHVWFRDNKIVLLSMWRYRKTTPSI